MPDCGRGGRRDSGGFGRSSRSRASGASRSTWGGWCPIRRGTRSPGAETSLGRERERAALEAFLERAGWASRCNVVETHPDPDKALCDGPNSIPLNEMETLLKTLLAVKKAATGRLS